MYLWYIPRLIQNQKCLHFRLFSYGNYGILNINKIWSLYPRTPGLEYTYISAV